MDIPYETEAELRMRGTARTPDILLSCPMGIRCRRKESSCSTTIRSDGAIVHGQRHQEKEVDDRSSFLKRQSLINLEDGEDDEEYEWKIICWIDSKVCCANMNSFLLLEMRKSNSFSYKQYVKYNGKGFIWRC